MISAMCTSEQPEKSQASGLGLKTVSLSRVLDARAINLRIRHLRDLVSEFFLSALSTLRSATLYIALVCAAVEGAGLVSSRSCQSQGAIWEKRGFLMLVPPLSF